MGQKTKAITVTIPLELYDHIGIYVGENYEFATMGEFANVAVHFYIDRLIVFLSEYNNALDKKITEGNIVLGGSKLGLIYRYLHTDKDWNYEEDGYKQLTIRVTAGLAEQIDTINRTTGFFNTRADFCRNALGCYASQLERLGHAFYAMREESKEAFERQYVIIKQAYFAVDKPAKPGFGVKSKADAEDWLN